MQDEKYNVVVGITYEEALEIILTVGSEALMAMKMLI